MIRKLAIIMAVVIAAAALLCACGDDDRKVRPQNANQISVTLKPVISDNTENEVLQDANSVAQLLEGAGAGLKQRLALAGVTDVSVSTDKANLQLTVSYPKDSADKVTDKMLTEPGILTFRNSSGEVLMDSRHVESAEATTEESSYGAEFSVLIHFTTEGTELFKEITGEYIGQTIALYIDDDLISAPTVPTVISDGKALISGIFTAEEAAEMAAKINAEHLPFPLEIVERK